MILTRIGQPAAGGYFSGLIRDPTQIRAIIVSPAQYTVNTTLLPSEGLVGMTSHSDGSKNTALLVEHGSEIASRVTALEINNSRGWYIASVLEAMSTYRYLRPDRRINWNPKWEQYPNYHRSGVAQYNTVAVPSMLTTPDCIETTLVVRFQQYSVTSDAFFPSWHFTSTETVFDPDDISNEDPDIVAVFGYRTESRQGLAGISYCYGNVDDVLSNQSFPIRPIRSIVVVK